MWCVTLLRNKIL